MDAGHGVTRAEIAWNDFIVVGRARIRPSIEARTTRFRPSRQSERQAPSSRAATRAPDARKSASGQPPALITQATAAGARDIAAAWARRSMPAAAKWGVHPLRPWHLVKLFQTRATCDRRGGGTRPADRYGRDHLNPEEHAPARWRPAGRLAAWLLSPEGQSAIGRLHGSPASACFIQRRTRRPGLEPMRGSAGVAIRVRVSGSASIVT